jgi:hypothetical protein
MMSLIHPSYIQTSNLGLNKELANINEAWLNPKFCENGKGKIYSVINNSPESVITFIKKVESMVAIGLAIKGGDYFIHEHFGNTVELTVYYKAFPKAVDYMARKKGFTHLMSYDALTAEDNISLSFNGSVDTLTVQKSGASLLGLDNGKQVDYISAYATSTLLNQQGEMIFRKSLVIPAREFQQILSKAKKGGINTQWKYAFAIKAAIRRLMKMMINMFYSDMEINLESSVSVIDQDIQEKEQKMNPLPIKEQTATPKERVGGSDISKLEEAFNAFAKFKFPDDEKKQTACFLERVQNALFEHKIESLDYMTEKEITDLTDKVNNYIAKQKAKEVKNV